MIYEQASGARLNKKKTFGIGIGQWKDRNFNNIGGIKWVKKADSLGVTFGYDIDREDVWLAKIEKIKTTFKNWAKRNLSLKGKILLIKSYGMSRLIYLADAIGLPKHIEQAARKMFYGAGKVGPLQ